MEFQVTIYKVGPKNVPVSKNKIGTTIATSVIGIEISYVHVLFSVRQPGALIKPAFFM